jgi:hypothetical protein
MGTDPVGTKPAPEAGESHPSQGDGDTFEMVLLTVQRDAYGCWLPCTVGSRLNHVVAIAAAAHLKEAPSS